MHSITVCQATHTANLCRSRPLLTERGLWVVEQVTATCNLASLLVMRCVVIIFVLCFVSLAIAAGRPAAHNNSRDATTSSSGVSAGYVSVCRALCCDFSCDHVFSWHNTDTVPCVWKQG